MAAAGNTTSVFIAQLLAPLSPNIEAADTRHFRRDLRNGLRDAWELAKARYWERKKYRDWQGSLIALAGHERRHLEQAERRRDEHLALQGELAAFDRLMMTPAPGRTALNWKRANRSRYKGRDRWEAAIAADEAKVGRS